MSDRKLVIFDFDGTLIDSNPGFHQALKEYSEARGLPHDPQKMMIGYVDPLTYDLGWDVPLTEQPRMLKELQQEYRKEMMENGRFMPELYAQVQEVLAELAKEYDLSIITARGRETTLLTLSYHKIDHYFPVIRTSCCADERGYLTKPARDAVDCLIKETFHRPEDVVMVGDTTADIGMANNAGIKSIAVLWGYHPKEKLQALQPTAMIDTIIDLPEALRKIFSRQ